MTAPLSGVRVLDLSRVLAGPWATQLLADFGAEVIKIERPGEGDETRGWGPPWAMAQDGSAREAAYFLCANRGKESVAIDMAHPQGSRLLRDLAARCDVLVENFKVDGLKKYGLDYDSLKQINPGLVYCSITGFGQDGPYAQRAGYDFVIQGLSGLMSVTGAPEGEPMKVGVALTDVLTGLYAANAIQAALRWKEKTGEGQHIDVALLDVQIAAMANQALNYLTSGRNPGRFGNAHPNIVPYQTFRARDGHITVAVGNDGQFARLCAILGRPDLATDLRFATNAARVGVREVLVAALQTAFEARDAEDWLLEMEAAGVPAGRINTMEQVFQDPQVIHRGVKLTLDHPTVGTVAGVACPVRMSATPPAYHRAPPTLGQHTREVLGRELGLTDADIAGLEQTGAI
jgi:crotonobetainyl-CoA:carnitine CoA-transferase CaiB-like acyl-CoA transferase